MLLISTWHLDTQRLHVAVLHFSFNPALLQHCLRQGELLCA